MFAACAPGLEAMVAAELAALGAEDIKVTGGGVEFSGRFNLAYGANLMLRRASRIWLRLSNFRVRGWDDLTRQVGRIPWEVLLPPDAPLAVQVSLNSSNLKHSGAIAKAVLEGAALVMQAAGVSPPHEATAGAPGARRVLVRAQDRRCVISLDTSGEHLHRRGYRLRPGKAPLREDIASALLAMAGYDGSRPLLDAMCGAGTLAIEAALMARGLAPALQRRPGLADWACHRRAFWQNLQKRARDEALNRAPSPIVARDISPAAVRDAAFNAARAGVDQDIAFKAGDFFAMAPPPGPGLVVINPPYGLRMGSEPEGRKTVEHLGRRLREAYSGWRVALVLYRPQWARLGGLRNTRSMQVPFGGISVTLLTGVVSVR